MAMQTRTREEVVAMIPEGFGEREAKPRSVRWPKDLAKRVDAAARETGNEWTPTLFWLVKWALDERDAQKAPKK